MKNLSRILIILLFSLGIVSVPLTVYAESNTSHIVLAKNETVNKDYFAAGNTVTLSGTVNGDAYVAGRNVIVEGTVNGDLLAAGGTVTIRGKVTQDVRVAGGQIIVTGDIGRNLTTVGGSVTITDNAKVNGSLVTGAGNLSVFAPIGKEANIGAGHATLGNTIHGNVQAGVGQLTLLPSSNVTGNLTYWSDKNALIDPEASVSGTTTHHYPPNQHNEQREKAVKTAFAGISVGFTIFSFLAALVVGLLLITFAPIYTEESAKLILKKPLLTLGIGFLSIVLFPFLFLLLLITIIGIPLDLLLLAGFLMLLYLAKIIVGLAIGQKVFSYLDQKVALPWIFIVGLIIYYVLSLIPLLGFIFWIIAGLMGLGALVLQKKYMYTNFRKKNLL